MLPGVGPGAVAQRVANPIVSDGIAVIDCQQVAPGGISVGIIDGIQHCTQRACRVGILFLALDIAGIVVSPGPGFSRRLVVLPGQLIGTVVGIADGIRSIVDRQDIAIVIVSIGESPVITGSINLVLMYKSCGGTGGTGRRCMILINIMYSVGSASGCGASA